MSTAALEYASRMIAAELAHKTRPESKSNRSHAYWYALYELADQLPPDLVTVFPAAAEGLFSVGPFANRLPYSVDRYPAHLRTIDALHAHLVELANARREDYSTVRTPLYSFSFRTAADGQMDHRGSDLMYLRQHGYRGTPPIGYLWTTGITSTTVNPDSLRVEHPPLEGFWIGEGSDLRAHRDRLFFTSPVDAFRHIATGVLRWARYTFDGQTPSVNRGNSDQVRELP